MSCIREELEALERETLSPYAALSSESQGRDRAEEPDDIRPCFERDRDRIIHCKAFRRLKHKTQVFIAPEGDHYRTRLTHTLEVSQIARTFGKALRLNEDLVEAIALGHDLGHTPFGHSGEHVLNSLCHEGFSHVEQSVRVVEVLEKNGRGLNLTKEVRDGILNHRTSGHPNTLEGQAVRFADKIAYINHDIDDSIRAGLIREEEIPSEISDILGHSVKDRLNVLIHDVIYQSKGQPVLTMSAPVEQAMQSCSSASPSRSTSSSISPCRSSCAAPRRRSSERAEPACIEESYIEEAALRSVVSVSSSRNSAVFVV